MSDPNLPQALETATFGAGCFWCVEAVLTQVPGVVAATSGFMGGEVSHPSYRAVCTGETGHVEVVQVEFRPDQVTYDDLLDWFWRLHDPTTRDRQGADVGKQYRSAIFTHSDEQRSAAESSKSTLDSSDVHPAPIVTEILPAQEFYSAEKEHDDYYKRNKDQGYCRMVIAPKLEKLNLET